MPLKNLKINALLVGHTINRQVECKGIFSSIGEIRIEGHRVVARVIASTIIELRHHPVRLCKGSWRIGYSLVDGWYGRIVISIHEGVDGSIALINIDDLSLLATHNSYNLNIIIRSSSASSLI